MGRYIAGIADLEQLAYLYRMSIPTHTAKKPKTAM